jgi:hypothetical protein
MQMFVPKSMGLRETLMMGMPRASALRARSSRMRCSKAGFSVQAE